MTDVEFVPNTGPQITRAAIDSISPFFIVNCVERSVSFYRDKLKTYGNVLECHTDKHNDPGNVNVNIDSKDTKSHDLKCDQDKGTTVELKVGNDQYQHIVSVSPQDGGKGSDFALVFLQIHGGDKDKGTI